MADSKKTLLRAAILIMILSATLLLLRFLSVGRLGMSPVIANTIFIAALAAYLVSLVTCSIVTENRNRSWVILAFTVLLAVLLRMIPNLLLEYPPLNDPYYEIVGHRNVALFGTISPGQGNWYPQMSTLMHWPLMVILSGSSQQVSGLEEMFFIRFFAPLLSPVFVLSVYLLGREITRDNRIANLAAIMAACIDVIVFNQSEYHPQGVAISLFFLVLFSMTRANRTRRPVFTSMFALFAFSLVLSHHFTSFLITGLGAIMILVCSLDRPIGGGGKTEHSAKGMQKKYSSFIDNWALLVVVGLAFASFVGSSTMKEFFEMTMGSIPNSKLITYGSGVPIMVTVLGTYKWILILLALPAILLVLKKKTREARHIVFVLGAILVSMAVVNFLTGGPQDRLIAFSFPMVSLLVAMTFVSWISRDTRRTGRRRTVVAATVLTTLALMSVLNSQIPAIYFMGTQPDTYYWYSNDLSTNSHYESAGLWISQHTDKNATFTTEFDTFVIPFYYAEFPISQRTLITNANASIEGLFVMNPNIIYRYHGYYLNKNAILQDANYIKLFDDGQVNMLVERTL